MHIASLGAFRRVELDNARQVLEALQVPLVPLLRLLCRDVALQHTALAVDLGLEGEDVTEMPSRCWMKPRFL